MPVLTCSKKAECAQSAAVRWFPMKIPVLDLFDHDSWPAALRGVLAQLRPTFTDWELETPMRTAGAYDRATRTLGEALKPYALRGYHFTRLTKDETAGVQKCGMALSGTGLLLRRIAAQVAVGNISPADAAIFLANNQAHERNRAGQTWFCFYPPAQVSESGVSSLLAYWGGEALYNTHAEDARLGPLLKSIGRPAVVEADVPVAFLSSPMKLAGKIVELDMEHNGIKAYRHPTKLEDYSTQPIPADRVCRVVLQPSPEFEALTRCDRWRNPSS